MRRVLCEPSLHFLILGVALFALHRALNGDAPHTSHEVIVDQPRVAALATQFQRIWQRPPTAAELQGLIDSWVREEIIYREGLGAGMDRDDEVVRRRVVQKMTFMTEAMAANMPSEADLQEWLRKHQDDYRAEPYYTLHQVYFDPRKHGNELQKAIRAAMVTLERNPQADVGDASMLPAMQSDASTRDVARVFGEPFGAALLQLPLRRWTGPVESGFGVHLVFIEERTPARVPPLAEIRKAVERDVITARTQDAKEEFYRALRQRYTVKIDAGPAKLSAAPTRKPAATDFPLQAAAQ